MARPTILFFARRAIRFGLPEVRTETSLVRRACGTGSTRDRAASCEGLLDERCRVLHEGGSLGLVGLDQLQQLPSLVRTLQADREPDADPVVGHLEGLRPDLVGKLGQDLAIARVSVPP